MIDSICIFTKGGLVLFRYNESDIEGQPLSHLIQQVLIQERQGLSSFKADNYVLKWVLANEYNLVLTSTSLNIGKINQQGIDDILQSVKETFIDQYKADLQSGNYQNIEDYNEQFLPFYQKIVRHLEKGSTSGNTKKPKQQQQQQQSKKPTVTAQQTNPEESNTTTTTLPTINVDDVDDSITSNLNSPNASPSGNDDGEGDDSDPTTPSNTMNDAELRLLKRLEDRKQNRAANKNNNNTPNNKKNNAANNKKATKWSDSKVSKEEAQALDMSEGVAADAINQSYGVSQKDIDSTIASHGQAPKKGESYFDYNTKDNEKDLEIKLKRAQDDAANNKNSVWGYLQGLVGQKELTKEDLADVGKQFSQRLIDKNVNPEIAEKLVESVLTGLVGKKLGTFNTMYATIKEMLEESLTRLLTPKKPIDVLTGVAQAQRQGRPYSVVFCGVNGVGKSTSLSKIAAFFLAQGLTVGVAACDTFRSGAIEQLKTHCAALKIPLYDKGYGKDEASVAAEGIMRAKKDGLDVILIDTAGRMQGNDPLMKGLARLMNVNDPDLILFVGEALVGNDGCDQLVNFNRALRENSGKQHPRLIDGIVLTKFDTIDDKVGTAINMIYSTGQPIVFVGVGQTYRDLKRPHPKIFIDQLLG